MLFEEFYRDELDFFRFGGEDEFIFAFDEGYLAAIEEGFAVSSADDEIRGAFFVYIERDVRLGESIRRGSKAGAKYHPLGLIGGDGDNVL